VHLEVSDVCAISGCLMQLKSRRQGVWRVFNALRSDLELRIAIGSGFIVRSFACFFATPTGKPERRLAAWNRHFAMYKGLDAFRRPPR
jgi:hypothetical protein